MTATVFLAVLFAALLHAPWNALVRAGDKHVAMTGVVLGHVPIPLAVPPFVLVPPIEALPWLAAGIALHLGYQLFLIAGYRIGDLTQVYPIARGVAPLIAAGHYVRLTPNSMAPLTEQTVELSNRNGRDQLRRRSRGN